jgi:PmbA protein
MSKRQENLDLVQSAVEMSKRAGADAAEVCAVESNSVEIEVSGGELEIFSAVRDSGVAVRILKDQKMVFGSSNDLAPASIQDMISGLMRKVEYHTEDPFYVIPGREFGWLEGDWSQHGDRISWDDSVTAIGGEEKVDLALRMEAAAMEADPRIVGAQTTAYSDQEVRAYLANSEGLSGWYPASSCQAYTNVIASDGDDQQAAFEFFAGLSSAGFDPETVGRKAAEKAVRMLGAKPIQSCELPLVISPFVATEILGYLAGMLSADEVQKGRSLFADRVGSQVAAPIFNLIDDGTLKDRLGTRPVDGEGVPSRRTPLVVDGVLEGFLHNAYTAKKGGEESTGNHARSGYQSPGGVGTSNLYVAPGNKTDQEILASIPDGVMVSSVIGLHAGVDPASGDFSIPMAGYRISRGEVANPIRGVTIGGNLFDLLMSVEAVGNELTWVGPTASPSLAISSVKIGGI